MVDNIIATMKEASCTSLSTLLSLHNTCLMERIKHRRAAHRTEYCAERKAVIFRQLRHQGETAVNTIGIWSKGHRQPLWVMTDLAPEQGLAIYQARTKIEQSFRDLKSLLHLDKIMNKSQTNMEKMIALVMIAYTLGSWWA